MDVLDFLKKHKILWQPIHLVDKKPQCLPGGIIPKTNDHRKLSAEDFAERQKIKSEYIAIYTHEVQQIDIDKKEAISKYDFLKNCPYYKSITKELPHYFVFIENYKTEGAAIIGGDMLTGKWAWCKRNAKVYNADNAIEFFDSKKFEPSFITEQALAEKIKLLRAHVSPDCDYDTWYKIIQNIYNVAAFHLYDGIHYATLYSQDSTKYDEKAKTTIKNLKVNQFSARGSYNYLNNLISPTKKDTKEKEKEDDWLGNFFKENEGLIYYCNTEIWMRDDIYIWRNDRRIVSDMIYQWLFENYPEMSIRKGTERTNHIMRSASKFCRDEDFTKKFQTTVKGVMCFRNGVLEIKTGKFYSWDSDFAKTIYTDKFNNFNYDVNENKDLEKELMDRVFNPIFNDNTELIKSVLNLLIRALDPCIDKNFSTWIGSRNSGKGVVTKLCLKLNGYVTTFDPNNLLQRMNEGETSKKNAWKLPFTQYRLVIGNEITVSDKSIINGVDIKQISSAEDEIKYRELYKNEVVGRAQAHMLLLVNDLPNIKPEDTYQNMLYIDMPCAFQEVPSSMSIRRDPDPEIKSFVGRDDVAVAFIKLLLKHRMVNGEDKPDYEIMKAKAKEIRPPEEIDISEQLKTVFSFTKNEEDFISNSVIKNELNHVGIILTDMAKYRVLTKLGCKPKRGAKGRGFTGIRLNREEEETTSMFD